MKASGDNEVVNLSTGQTQKRVAGGGESRLVPSTHGLDGPACSNCGSIMQRAGTCYACSECGNTSGCS